MFEYRITNNSILINKYTGAQPQVQIPDTIEGLPVTALDAYALSGREVTEIYLPASLRRIGRYAFYNCFSLTALHFHSSIGDIGAGAFTGCHKIALLDVTIVDERPSCLKEILMELPEEIQVDYHHRGQYTCLLFPEYYEEGVENTPARIIEHHTHGSGLHYRNCFRGTQLQFSEYDRQFQKALNQESDALSIELALNRLMYPYCLDEGARQTYTAYLAHHLDTATRYLLKANKPEKLSFLMELHRREAPAPADRFQL